MKEEKEEVEEEGEEVEKQVAGTKPRYAEADDADNDAGVITSFASTH